MVSVVVVVVVCAEWLEVVVAESIWSRARAGSETAMKKPAPGCSASAGGSPDRVGSWEISFRYTVGGEANPPPRPEGAAV